MSRTIADSKNYDIVFLSYQKEEGKELEVENFGEKDNQFIESMNIKAGKAELLKDGTLVTENGKIANFTDYKEIKEINEKKITKFAIEKRKESNSQARA